MSAADRPKADNPFSACCIRPGAIRYLFPEGQCVAGLLERLQAEGWWGQILGAHGTGKSALLATLIPAIEQSGRAALLIELHDGARRLPRGLEQLAGLSPGTVVIIDGYEQLSRWSRWRVKRFCRQRRLGLLVTAHRSVGLPLVSRTESSLALAQRLIGQLSPDCASWVSQQELQERYALHGGNLRELLFDLYDRYERHHRQDGTGPDWAV